MDLLATRVTNGVDKGSVISVEIRANRSHS
jgi:hypothetical protein